MSLTIKHVKGLGLSICGLAVLYLAGCAQQTVQTPPVSTTPEPPEACVVPAEGDQLIGNWLSKRQEKGVSGELRTLFTLHSNGEMSYTEQLKRPRQPSQGLSETGCWWREGSVLVIETRESNSVVVDTDDPIYTNRFQVKRITTDKLNLANPVGSDYSLSRTSPGYRLPF